ncbi:hypothetical protein ACOTVQ_06605 [Aliarcobacter butzleri]
MSFLENNKKVFLVLFFIYFIVNIPLLANLNAIYWDDWTLVGHSLETLNKTFLGAVGYSGYATSYLHYFMINDLGIYSYRLLTFILLFLSGFFVYMILTTLKIFSLKDRFFITLFFLVAPLYSAKIALIDFPYTFYSAIFFLSFYILSIHIYNLGIIKRIFILTLFFISFLVNSILIFYAIVLIYIFYKTYDIQSSFIRNFIYFLKTKIDFIILPIIYYCIKSIYFIPNGAHEGYNTISLFKMVNPEGYLKTIVYSFFEPILNSFSDLLYLISILFVFILFFNYFRKMNILDNIKYENENKKIILGFLIFILGAMAYLAVGKIPKHDDWNSRFQLLLPLGFSLIYYYVLNEIFKKQYLNYLLILSIVSFGFFHFKEQIKYNIDWYYQESIIENFKVSEKIKNNSTFIFINNLGNNLNNRNFRFYELNGMSRFVLNDDSKLFVENSELIDDYKKYSKYIEYNFSSWKESEPVTIFINDNSKAIFGNNRKNKLKFFIKLKYLELFDKEKYKKEVIKLVEIG